MKQLSIDDRVSIEALLSEYGWRLDHGGDVGELFAPEGAIVAPSIGLDLRGRAAISSHFASHASTHRTTCHMWSSLRIEEYTGQGAELTTIQMTFLRLPNEPPTAKRILVGNTRDVVRKEQSGHWLFLARRLEVIFPFDLQV